MNSIQFKTKTRGKCNCFAACLLYIRFFHETQTQRKMCRENPKHFLRVYHLAVQNLNFLLVKKNENRMESQVYDLQTSSTKCSTREQHSRFHTLHKCLAMSIAKDLFESPGILNMESSQITFSEMIPGGKPSNCPSQLVNVSDVPDHSLQSQNLTCLL